MNILLPLAIIAISTVGYFVFIKKSDKKIPSTPDITPTITDTPIPTQLPTSGSYNIGGPITGEGGAFNGTYVDTSGVVHIISWTSGKSPCGGDTRPNQRCGTAFCGKEWVATVGSWSNDSICF
jgi:hypothetical protein